MRGGMNSAEALILASVLLTILSVTIPIPKLKRILAYFAISGLVVGAVLFFFGASLGITPIGEHTVPVGEVGTTALIRNVEYDCPLSQSVMPGGSQGYVEWGADGKPVQTIHIAKEVCADLRDLKARASSTTAVDATDVSTVHVLAHEAEHVKGVMNEATAECYAMQNMDLMAVFLGVPESVAIQYPGWYYANMYPNVGPGYSTPDCTQGGKLDITPADGKFP